MTVRGGRSAFFREDGVPDNMKTGVRDLAFELESKYVALARSVNKNSISFVSQNDAPTPAAGKMMVWKDADATAGQPTHYLVYNDGTSVVTFASQETV